MMNKKQNSGILWKLKYPEFFAFKYYNITEILKLYYNLVKTLDNIEKKNKILV